MNRSFIKFGAFIFTTSIVLCLISCNKALEDIVDCLGETSLTSINASIDSANSKAYTFNISYGGTNSLGTVKWKFGDGSEASVNGTAPVTHIFKEGTFEVTANAAITKGKEQCDSKVQKTVVVN